MLDSSEVMDDSSLRGKLVGHGGQRYVAFVRSLQPRYWVVYRDIALGYLCLILSLWFAAIAPNWGFPRLAAAAIGAILIGYWIAYLQLFLHEGAHYNLAPAKDTSDRISNLLISWLIGTTIASYRTIHFQHHRELGTVNDSEFTYFFPLNLLFLIKAAFGIRAVEVLLDRQSKTKKPAPAASARSGGALRSILLGASAHAAVIGACLYFGFWWAALAWLLGVGLVFPFFGALRQLLEHRSESADRKADYRTQDHGALTRLFGDGFFSSTFGGAGFNRHLLHHWEPQVSYTNLPELEAFLEGTPVKNVMDGRRTSYAETFRRLFSHY
jgi:fatty acid desaturase